MAMCIEPDLRSVLIRQIQKKESKIGNKIETLWPLETLSRQKEELSQVLQSCSSENNISVVLEGASGSGKTTLLLKCLEELKKTGLRFDTVWLNGYIHNTDMSAFNEIMRHLQIEYNEENQGNVQRDEHLRTVLEQGKDEGNTIIFILDDFDQFAQRPKQSLLYYLFDLQQNSAVQVCILATTTRHDAFTLLEKRVRSRFSDTKIRLPTTFEEADKLKLMFERLLTLPKPVGKLQRDYNKSVKNTLKQRKSQEKIHNLIMHGQCTPKLYENILISIVCDLEESKLTSEILINAIDIQRQSPQILHALDDCCVTQLIIICAMIRLKLMKKHKQYNFVQVINEIKSNEFTRNQDDDLIAEMIERLMDVRLVMTIPRQQRTLNRYKKMALTICARRAKRYIVNMKIPTWLKDYVKFAGS